MSTLAEVQAAAAALPAAEKEKLLRSLAAQLGEEFFPRAHTAPKPRGEGKASEWLRTARGSVRLEDGQTADDARLAYYARKLGVG